MTFMYPSSFFILCLMSLCGFFVDFLNYLEKRSHSTSLLTTDGGYEDELEDSSPPNPYHERQKAGAKWRKLIETKKEDVKAPKKSITSRNIDEIESLIVKSEPVSYPFLFREAEFLDGAPTEIIQVFAGETAWQRFYIRQPKDDFLWVGYTGPGVIIIESLYRSKTSLAPRVSEVIQAAYKRDHPLESLKYIFVSVGAGSQTMTCILENLNSSGKSWRESGLHTWKSASPQYDTILGSPLGEAIAHFILEAYIRGTVNLKQIHAWPQNEDSAYVRFDIEDSDLERRKKSFAMTRRIVKAFDKTLEHLLLFLTIDAIWGTFLYRVGAWMVAKVRKAEAKGSRA